MDLTSYLQNYRGFTKIARCHFIATTSTTEGLSRTAYIECLQLLKASKNSNLLQNVCLDAQKKFGSDEFPIDVEWIAKCEQSCKQEHAQLSESMKKLKMAAIKENIREAHNALGALFISEGNLQGAVKAYHQNKDYSSSPQHTMEFTEQMMVCAMDLGNWSSAMNSAVKLRHLANISSGASSSVSSSVGNNHDGTSNRLQVVQAGTAATQGLIEMRRGNYRAAANWFISTGIHLGNQTFNTIIRLDDVALYGGLCALATFERNELDDHVLRDSNFREILEINPKVREMIAAFHESKYALGFQCLSEFIPIAKLDIRAFKIKKMKNVVKLCHLY